LPGMASAARCLAITRYTPYASIELMQADICHALRDQDILVQEHMHSDFPNKELFRHQLAAIGKHAGRRFVFDTNLNHNYETNGQSIYDAWSLPRFSFLTDSPARKLDKLAGFPKSGLIGVVDEDFVELLGELEAPGLGAIPFQHAGPQPRRKLRNTSERPIDVLVLGNVSSSLTTDAWLDQDAAPNDQLRTTLTRSFERCRTETTALWKVFNEEAASSGYDPISKASYCDALCGLETHLIATRRREILSSLNSVATVFGGGTSRTNGNLHLGASVDARGALPFLDALELMEQSKIVIDISPSFRNGAHERVFYALSRGAFVLTEPSRFLTLEVENDLGIAFLPFESDDVENTIRTVLDRGPEELDAVRTRALAHYAGTHTWSQRVDTLLQSMDTLYWEQSSVSSPDGNGAPGKPTIELSDGGNSNHAL